MRCVRRILHRKNSVERTCGVPGWPGFMTSFSARKRGQLADLDSSLSMCFKLSFSKTNTPKGPGDRTLVRVEQESSIPMCSAGQDINLRSHEG